MRDTEVLRRRLWAQIGLPLATLALLSACDEGSKPAGPNPDGSNKAGVEPKVGEAAKGEGIDGDGDGDDAPAEAGAGPRVTTNDANEGYVPPMRLEDIVEGEFDYYGPARDPFGDHEEEEGCPSGDWCGSPEDARKFAIEHIPEQLGCPAKIIANPSVGNSLDKNAKRWEGFSFHPMMQGRLMSSVTKEARETKGDPQLCCYHWFEYCSGRPLLDGERMVLAELHPGSSWSCDPAEVAAPADRPDSALSVELRTRLGEIWIEDARMEHAAIGAFMRSTLELMAMAAPSNLLGELQEAAQDEVEHAQRCFGLAARFSGQPREPGALPTLEPRVSDVGSGADWIRLAVDTFVEGCVGETIAALVARRGLRRCADPASIQTLEQIVDDEGRHAGLAWQTVRWILEVCGEHHDAVADALRGQAQTMAEAAREASSKEALPAADPLVEGLGRFGRLDRRGELLARRDAWEDLILPTLDALAPAQEPGPEAWA